MKSLPRGEISGKDFRPRYEDMRMIFMGIKQTNKQTTKSAENWSFFSLLIPELFPLSFLAPRPRISWVQFYKLPTCKWGVGWDGLYNFFHLEYSFILQFYDFISAPTPPENEFFLLQLITFSLFLSLSLRFCCSYAISISKQGQLVYHLQFSTPHPVPISRDNLQMDIFRALLLRWIFATVKRGQE